MNPLRVCTAYLDGRGRPSIQITVGARSDQASIMYDRVARPTQIGRSFADFERAVGSKIAVGAAAAGAARA